MCKGTQTSQTVNTPPQNVLDQYDKVVGGANNIVANNPNGLPIAGFNDAQNLALNSFGNSTNTLAEAGGTGYDVANAGHVLSRMNLGAAGTYEPYFGQATGNLGQAGQYFGQAANGVGFNPVSGSDIAQYQDPFTQQVINATTANIDRSNAIQQQGVISDAIKSGNAFGGDRMGVAQAELGRNQDLAKNQTIAGLQSQGYSQALQEANNQQQLKTATGEFNTNAANQAGAGFANLAGQYGNLGSAAQSNVLGAYAGATGALNASTNAGNLLNSTALAGLQNNLGLLGAGTQLQQTTQQQMQAPYGQYGWLGQLSGFMNPGGGTSTTTGPAPFFSDKRLKEGVKVIGKTFDGMNVVSFRYKGDPSTRIGFIAQDVQKKHPDAVSSHGGVLAVDYDKASAGAAKRGHFAGGGGVGGSVGDPQNNLFPGLDLSGASPGLSPGIKMAMPGAPASKQDDGLGKAVTNKALDFGMNKAGAQLDKGFESLKSGLGLGSPPAAMPDMGSFGTAIMNDPGAAGLASGSGLAGSAADAGAAAAGMAAPVAADAAAEAGAAAAGSSIADILPFPLLKRGGRVEPRGTLGDAPRMRRAMGGRLHYDDGGAVDEYAGMNPTFRDRLMLTQADLRDQGIDSHVISGFRDGDKQDALYAQGRTAPGPIVTTAPAGHSMHNFGAAADLSPYDPSQKQAMYDAVSELAPENGLKWGGTFRNFYDPNHIQLPGTASQFAGRAPRGPADLGTASAYADAGSGDLGAAGRAIGDAAPSGSLGDAPAASNDNGGSLGSSIGDFVSQPGMGRAILAGIAGMLASKSHTFAGALGEGGLAGISSYDAGQKLARDAALAKASMGNTASEIATRKGQLDLGSRGLDIRNQQLQREIDQNNQRIELARKGLENSTANTASEIDARRAGMIEKTFIPGKGWVVFDKAHPELPPKIVSADIIDGDGTPGPSSAPSNPTFDAAPRPLPPRVPRTESSNGTMEPPATTAPADVQSWRPTTTLPQGYMPPNHMNLAVNPLAMKTEQGIAEDTLKQTRTSSNAARQALYRLDEMDQQIGNLPSRGFLAQGSFATERANFAKNANAIVTSFGGSPVFDQNNVAAIEELAKDRFRLGAELSRQIGGREPGFIVQQAVTANPGADNSAMGYKRIVAGLRASAAYDQDRAQFMDNYYSRYGHLNGAETTFQKLNPPEMYSQRAIVSTVDPRDADALRANVKNPSAMAAIDKKYGTGVSKLLLGEH